MISDGKPYLLEYNCRFGDPETQVIIPRLKDDLLPLLLECSEGNLQRQELAWDENKCVCVVAASRGYPESSSRDVYKRQKCVCVVAASRGYPESSSSGDVITGLDDFRNNEEVT